MIKRYFTGSLLGALIGLGLGMLTGFYYSRTLQGAVTTGFLTMILAVLEVSLSFDNAIVNAAVLKDMSPLWRRRFLTWGILFAVFGMRLVFPLVIVSFLADLSPWQALILAATRPDEYASIMLKSHLALAGFGGSFLLMVALKYFVDSSKDVHWLHVIEAPLVRLGKIEAVSIAFCLGLVYFISRHLPIDENHQFLVSSIFGLITFVLVDGVSAIIEESGSKTGVAVSGGLGLFMYLEILDASFSFDGVIGAFAVTHNLFVIAIGLGVGALFVRSLTIFLVNAGTLTRFRYLEHGAFYAIGALAILMMLEGLMHIPEVVTGLMGAIIIMLSLISSIYYNRRKANS